MPPFEVIYSQPPPMIIKYMFSSSKINQVDKELLDRDKISQLLRDNLIISQTNEHEFAMGDGVFLQL